MAYFFAARRTAFSSSSRMYLSHAFLHSRSYCHRKQFRRKFVHPSTSVFIITSASDCSIISLRFFSSNHSRPPCSSLESDENPSDRLRKSFRWRRSSPFRFENHSNIVILFVVHCKDNQSPPHQRYTPSPSRLVLPDAPPVPPFPSISPIFVITKKKK